MRGKKYSACEGLYWPEILKESTSRFYNLSITYYTSKMFISFTAGWLVYFLFIRMHNQVANTTGSLFFIFPTDSRADQHLTLVNLKTNHNFQVADD